MFCKILFQGNLCGLVERNFCIYPFGLDLNARLTLSLLRSNVIASEFSKFVSVMHLLIIVRVLISCLW